MLTIFIGIQFNFVLFHFIEQQLSSPTRRINQRREKKKWFHICAQNKLLPKLQRDFHVGVMNAVTQVIADDWKIIDVLVYEN